MTLLEKAKSISPQIRGTHIQITDEHIELAVAWAKGEITNLQAATGYSLAKSDRPKIYTLLARSLREAFRKGILK